jgi:hypothetical protein
VADRKVTKSRKNEEGDISALCDGGAWWSPRDVADAIRDIEGGTHTYYVQTSTGDRVDIHVVYGGSGKYLRTDPDKTESNNLDDLPDC